MKCTFKCTLCQGFVFCYTQSMTSGEGGGDLVPVRSDSIGKRIVRVLTQPFQRKEDPRKRIGSDIIDRAERSKEDTLKQARTIVAGQARVFEGVLERIKSKPDPLDFKRKAGETIDTGGYQLFKENIDGRLASSLPDKPTTVLHFESYHSRVAEPWLGLGAKMEIDPLKIHPHFYKLYEFFTMRFPKKGAGLEYLDKYSDQNKWWEQNKPVHANSNVKYNSLMEGMDWFHVRYGLPGKPTKEPTEAIFGTWGRFVDTKHSSAEDVNRQQISINLQTGYVVISDFTDDPDAWRLGEFSK